MRRVAVLIVAAALLAACGGDDGGQADATTTTAATLTTLGEHPTRAQCVKVMTDLMKAIEVPDDVDPSDGLTDDERASADAAVTKAGKDVGIDIDIEQDDPCEEALGDLTDAEFVAMTKGIDPEVIEMLGAQATKTFTSTGSAIN